MNTIISTALIMSLTVAIFSLLLTFSDKYISNYGKYQITINDETKITVNGGESLYECLDKNAVQIPIICGGKGTCGSCKVKVTSASTPLLPIEEIHLSEEDKLNGFRLSCQYRITENIKIEVPEEFLSSRIYDAFVHKIERISEDIKLLQLILPKNNIVFKPGQYIKFYCPIYKDTDAEIRTNFTIANFDSAKNILDLYIKLIPDGISENYIHNHLQQENSVTIAGPYTYFEYNESTNPIVLICNDYGYGNINSVMEFISKNNKDRAVSIIYVYKTEPDSLCNKIQTAFSDFTLHVHKVKWNEDDFSDVINLIDKDSNIDIYLCGNKILNKEIKKQLLINRFSISNIYSFDA